MNEEPEPRTIAGRAWVSGTRPHIRRGVVPTIMSIEREAAAPYAELLREAVDLLATDDNNDERVRRFVDGARKLLGEAT
jgi:hypothetical protein